MDKVSEAILLAADAFDGMKRKCGRKPAVLHSLECAVIVAYMTEDADVISAAALHDVVEDANVTLDTLEERFGSRVAELVSAESEDKRRDLPAADTWKIRKEESLAFLRNTKDPGIKMVFLGDKLANMRSIEHDLKTDGQAVWNRFNQTDPEQHHWCYRSMADALADLKEYPEWQEYDGLIRRVFHEK